MQTPLKETPDHFITVLPSPGLIVKMNPGVRHIQILATVWR